MAGVLNFGIESLSPILKLSSIVTTTHVGNTPVQSIFSLPLAAPPSTARVVIVGGGIVGCSVAYHLAKAGWKDVVLLEQGLLSGGTTWHAAGMIGQLRASNSMTQINKYSAQLYPKLAEETGHDVGWVRTTGLTLGTNPERMTQLRRTAAMAEVFGVEAHLIGPKEAQDLGPLIQVEDVLGAVYLPGDGRVIPGECAVALAKGAMAHGAALFDRTRVASLLLARDLSALYYPFLGVSKQHHGASHYDTEDDYQKIVHFQVSQLAYLAQRLDAMPEGESTVLDNSCLLFLSNMWSGTKHDNKKVPVVTIGGLGGKLKTGRALNYFEAGDDNRKLCSLYLGIMDRMGLNLKEFGDAETRLAGF